MRRTSAALIGLTLVLAAPAQARDVKPKPAVRPATKAAPCAACPHERLHAVLWMQHAAEYQAAAEVRRGFHRGHLVVDRLHAIDPRRRSVDQPASRDRGVVQPAVARLGVAPIDHPVRGEAGIERDVEQPALPARVDDGKPGDRRRQRTVVRDDAQTSGALGDEHPPVRQERETPRMLQSARDGLHVEGDAALL